MIKFSIYELLQEATKKTFDTFGTLIKGFLIAFMAGFFAALCFVLLNWNFFFSLKSMFPHITLVELCGFNFDCQMNLLKLFLGFIWSKGFILLLSSLALSFFYAGIWLGFTKYGLKVYDTNSATVNDLFPSFGQTFRFVVAGFLYSGIVCFGLLLLIVPGIYWAIRFIFFRLAIVDKDAGILESLKMSWAITQGQGWHLVLMALIITIVYSLAALIPFSMLVTMPLVLMTYVSIYRKMSQ